MLNDFTPYVYLTNDYGKTWKRIADGTNGIPIGDYTRVVREDPDRPGLLYGGTEHGMYISFDEGAHWQSFQQNLPRDADHGPEGLSQEPDRRDRRAIVLGPRRAAGRAAAQGGARARRRRRSSSRPTRTARAGRCRRSTTGSRMQPTAPVTLEVKDATGEVVYTTTAQPAAGRRRRRPPRFRQRQPPARAAAAAGAAVVAVAAGAADSAASAAARCSRARGRG